MTFAELQRGVFDDMQYQPAPKPGVQDRVRRYLNEGLERILRRPRLKNLRFVTMPFTSNPGQGFYGAPMVIERIDHVIDLTNGHPLTFRTRDWYRQRDPSVIVSPGPAPPAGPVVTARNTSTPSVWIPEGVGPMRREPLPSEDGYVYLWAMAGPTDTTQTLIMEATFYYGDTYTTYMKLTGATPVKINIQGMPPGTRITSLKLDSLASSYVFLQDLQAPPQFQSNPVAVIDASEFSSRHVGFRLYPTPSASLTYHLEGQCVIPRMRDDMDEPPFPDNFHEMLQCYARARFYRKDGRLQQSMAEMAEFERFAIDLTAYVEYPAAYKPVAGKLAASGQAWSDLGPNYPADRLLE